MAPLSLQMPLDTGAAAGLDEVALAAWLADVDRRVRDSERERIALELHDSTVQHIVAMQMGLERLRRILGATGQAPDVLEDMMRSARQAMKEVRVISYLLKPPVPAGPDERPRRDNGDDRAAGLQCLAAWLSDARRAVSSGAPSLEGARKPPISYFR